MRVCVVTPSFHPAIVYGGPIVSTYHTYSELAKQGLEVFVSTTNANGRTKLDVECQRFLKLDDRFFVKYYDDTVVGRFSWRFVLGVWKDIEACDIVRVEDVFSTYIPPALIYAKMLAKPILISARGVLSEWSLYSKRPLLKKIWLETLIRPFVRNEWWHATSERERAEILEFDRNANVVVIPNGIDMHAFETVQPLSTREYLAKFTGVDSPSRPILVSMGRLHRVKGFDVLIDAFAGLSIDYPRAVLLIAGNDDGERKRLEAQVARLGLGDRVIFTGEVRGTDKSAFLAGADVFALPSRNENFGNVYLEALAAGVPVVASKCTPWEDLESFGCGKWVENSPEATEAAIRELLVADRIEMRRRAREYARRLGWDRVASRFQSALSRIIEADHAPR